MTMIESGLATVDRKDRFSDEKQDVLLPKTQTMLEQKGILMGPFENSTYFGYISPETEALLLNFANVDGSHASGARQGHVHQRRRTRTSRGIPQCRLRGGQAQWQVLRYSSRTRLSTTFPRSRMTTAVGSDIEIERIPHHLIRKSRLPTTNSKRSTIPISELLPASFQNYRCLFSWSTCPRVGPSRSRSISTVAWAEPREDVHGPITALPGTWRAIDTKLRCA